VDEFATTVPVDITVAVDKINRAFTGYPVVGVIIGVYDFRRVVFVANMDVKASDGKRSGTVTVFRSLVKQHDNVVAVAGTTPVYT
jgi:cobalamin synthase